MEFIHILIGLVVLVLIYMVYANKKEHFNPIVNKEQICKESTTELNQINDYISTNCSKQANDKANFRNAINGRNWCRLKQEEQIVMEFNKNSYC